MSQIIPNIESKLRFIVTSFANVKPRAPDEKEALLINKIVDSLVIIKMITFIEEEFNIITIFLNKKIDCFMRPPQF